MTKLVGRKPRFTTPIEPIPAGIIGSKLFTAKNGYETRSNAFIGRLNELADFHSIPDDEQRYLKLALRLAIDHVDGFVDKPGRGRRKSWTPEVDALLLIEMWPIINSGKTLGLAGLLLSKRKHWKAFLTRSMDRERHAAPVDPGEVLRRRYVEIRNEEGATKFMEFYSSVVKAGAGEKLVALYRRELMNSSRK